MNYEEELVARQHHDAIRLAGQDGLQARLLPGLRALCRAALRSQHKSSLAITSVRAINARNLRIALEQRAAYSVLRDLLTCQTWYEIACRGGDAYKPRGVVDVAQWWAATGLSLASLGTPSEDES